MTVRGRRSIHWRSEVGIWIGGPPIPSEARNRSDYHRPSGRSTAAHSLSPLRCCQIDLFDRRQNKSMRSSSSLQNGRRSFHGRNHPSMKVDRLQTKTHSDPYQLKRHRNASSLNNHPDSGFSRFLSVCASSAE